MSLTQKTDCCPAQSSPARTAAVPRAKLTSQSGTTNDERQASQPANRQAHLSHCFWVALAARAVVAAWPGLAPPTAVGTGKPEFFFFFFFPFFPLDFIFVRICFLLFEPDRSFVRSFVPKDHHLVAAQSNPTHRSLKVWSFAFLTPNSEVGEEVGGHSSRLIHPTPHAVPSRPTLSEMPKGKLRALAPGWASIQFNRQGRQIGLN
ncbi:hypothetical protein IWX50DRAFT_256218 [Phyllosticta citricarpa]